METGIIISVVETKECKTYIALGQWGRWKIRKRKKTRESEDKGILGYPPKICGYPSTVDPYEVNGGPIQSIEILWPSFSF